MKSKSSSRKHGASAIAELNKQNNAIWSPPATAPRNGTLILGDFGWPWPLLAVWDEYDEQWVTATLQSCPMKDGEKNSYIETDTEKGCALKRWTPLPLLPNDQTHVST